MEDQNSGQTKTGGSKTGLIIVLVVIALLIAGGLYYWFGYRSKIITGGGQTTSIAKDGGKAVKPVNFPKDMPLYPDAIYDSYTVSATAGSSYGANTNDSQDKVMAWFKTEVVKAGWTIDVEVPGHMLSLSKGDLLGSVNCEALGDKNRITFSELPKSAMSQEELDSLQGSKDLLNKMNSSSQ